MTEWNLKELKIELAQWGEFKGKYIGKVTFENGSSDCFMFTLSPEEIAEYDSHFGDDAKDVSPALQDRFNGADRSEGHKPGHVDAERSRAGRAA